MRRRGIGRVGRPGLVGTAARTAVIAGTATAVSGKVASAQQAAAQQAAAQQAAAQQAVAPPAAAPPQAPVAAAPAPSAEAPATNDAGGLSDEVVDQLRKLAELRDAGIVTDDEFTAKKRQLLGL
jgi:hypothetical protein